MVAESQLPADLQPVQATFGGQIELVGYTANPTLRRPGDSQSVTLYWRARQPMAQDYALALHLVGQGLEEVGKLDTWPGGGNAPTSQWQPGVILADTYALPISRTATTPSLLKLNLAFWQGQADHQLPITGPTGEPLQTVSLKVGRVAPAASPVLRPAVMEGTRFEYGISLLGAEDGGGGRLTLFWKTDQTVPADYTVFLHLVDATGRQVASADGPPLGGDWPTTAWVPGQALADPRQFDLPLAPGQYTVQLGFYDPASGARVDAYRADGAEWPDDVVVLKDVIGIK